MSTLANKLCQAPYFLPTVVLSIDDLYLTHDHQIQLAASNPTNPLIQHRGQPSTHDLPLALSLFSNLRNGKEANIPSYDKSAYGGQGDRVPKKAWKVVNQEGQLKTKIVIFEGWCVGFRALPKAQLTRRWENAVREREGGQYRGRLGWNKFADIEFINSALIEYDKLTSQLDALIHLDAEDPMLVYQWRRQQESSLRETKGSGMKDEQVLDFVNGCMHCFECKSVCR